ncbi:MULTISPECIES: tyrosine-type recombinase/integrase [Shewanella]|uniref:tyrosine-type recombinase/integrase n=1 Tax=Shewanella TaxID=22 RepID=UPI000DFBBE1F|nr:MULTISPECIES: site-specific integrase [Shewanella]MCU8004140.1 site-specific integrase [Shewanella sp. SM96]SUI78392.1 Tyrosine recombinase XerC [Shewanella baltica]
MTTATPYALYLSRLSINSQRSISSQMRSIARLMQWQEDCLDDKLCQIDYQQALQIRAMMTHAQWSARSINRAMIAIKNIVKVAALMNKADLSQVANLQTINQVKHGEHQGTPLSTEQVTAVLDYCKTQKGTFATRNLVIFSLFLGTGLRRSELSALMLSDYDANLHTLTVAVGKGNKSRTLFLPEWVEKNLLAWLKLRQRQQGYLVCKSTLTGKLKLTEPTTPTALYRLVKDTLYELGVDNVSPHDLRRTFITRLLEQNVDINTVRQMAGHADISTTTIYDKRDHAFMKQAAAMLDYIPPEKPIKRGRGSR